MSTEINHEQGEKTRKNLEIKLRNDVTAFKKVLKWAKTIQDRIERTTTELENLKQHKKNTDEKISHFKSRSKIPVPLRLVKTHTFRQLPVKFKFPKSTTTNSSLTNLEDVSKSKTQLQNHPIIEKTFQPENKAPLNHQKSVDLSSSISITNSIDMFIHNRFEPIVRRLEKLELQIDSNELLIEKVKTNIDSMSKNIDINTNEMEKCANYLKNILSNSSLPGIS